MDVLQRRYVRALASALFPVEGQHVDHHHTFMVQYKEAEDRGLDMHTDACDVTLNVCLGKDFMGAGLTFCGLRGGGAERQFSYRHKHVKGRAIMHAGHQRHGADDIISGERFNLIMWNKSSSFRASRDYMSKMVRSQGSAGPFPSEEMPAETPDLVCLSYTHDDDYDRIHAEAKGRLTVLPLGRVVLQLGGGGRTLLKAAAEAVGGGTRSPSAVCGIMAELMGEVVSAACLSPLPLLGSIAYEGSTLQWLPACGQDGAGGNSYD
eukprot:CAMPEP_0115863934 /NCGR_PEP_ID=MMETSP0287-20121206/18941_1 /TAXON_ID=412157 /ORGANISM="Chrysochromulina rotalis, Strain UIO044" /LENGTH=263 /DNA_ID=CAMNT_0003318389 /DNA_START=6 /DNA_END=798 /DNA_ORIENTATION=+